MYLSITIFLIAIINTPPVADRYIFYLHGKIVEDQGDNAVNPAFGVYQYSKIIDALKKEDFNVISEIRKPNTNIREYALHVSKQIDTLLHKGVRPENITVLGASKGALIAMYVSTFQKKKNMNFVFLAACNDGNFDAFPDITFYGNILSLHESSDDIGVSCMRFKDRSSITIDHYKEIKLNTGYKHGFIFQPYPEWLFPAVKWARGDYE